MPFNGTGTYTPAAAPNFPAVAGAVINATYYNVVINDVATALTLCITRDGQGKPSSAMNWNAQNLTNVGSLGIGVAAPVLPVELMTSGLTMGSFYSSSATTSEFYFGSAVVQGMLAADFAGTTIYIGTKTNHNLSFRTNAVERLRITNAGIVQDANGFELGFKTIPRDTTITTAVVGMKGKCTALTAGMTIPSAVFAAGDSFSLYNDSAANITITQGGGLTLRFGGTTSTGNRTLGARGLVTVWFNTANEAIIQGSGIS